MHSKKIGLCDGAELFLRVNAVRWRFWTDVQRKQPGDKARSDYHWGRMIIVKSALVELGLPASDDIADEIVNNYKALKLKSFEYLPGAEELLSKLQNSGVKMALLTNGEAVEQREKIERSGVHRFFQACFVEGELGYGKPDPRMFNTALESLQVTAGQSWMVGNDLYFDIEGARRSGIYSIWCDHEKTDLPVEAKTKPDRVIHNLTELLG
jgi:putative hydrolase of the HAD superfamily